MAAVCAQAAVECSAAVLDAGVESVAQQSWAVITEAAARCRPGASARPPRSPTTTSRGSSGDCATAACATSPSGSRSAAEPAAAEQLWTECTRRAPAPLDAAPATLLAVSAWLRGDGAMANVALDRALQSVPDYGLARLLREALAACVTPADLRALLTEAADAPALG